MSSINTLLVFIFSFLHFLHLNIFVHIFLPILPRHPTKSSSPALSAHSNGYMPSTIFLSFAPCTRRLETVQELQIHRSGCPVLSCSVTVLRSPCSVSWRAAKRSTHSDMSKDQTGGLHNAKKSDSTENNSVAEDEAVLYVGIFGDTAGVISVWLLPGSVVPSNICNTAW
jgi:hypothetical protein